MLSHASRSVPPSEATLGFYRRALDIIGASEVRFLIGGAFALRVYTGIERNTKDLDIFVKPADCKGVLDLFAAAGFRTEPTFPHWLGKVFWEDSFIDIIFSSGNGMCEVDETWFERAVDGEVLGKPVKLCPLEEIIWQKAFIMERERFDGADVAHFLLLHGKRLDWPHLLRRFGSHWRVLLAHLILFGYIYPDHRSEIPDVILEELLQRLREEVKSGNTGEPLCQGTLLSREQYLPDLECDNVLDARLAPGGSMTAAEIDQWTAAIGSEPPCSHH